MRLVNNFCNKLASSTNLTNEQQEIITFGAESAVSTLYSTGLMLLLSWLLGVIPTVLYVFIPFAIMKSFAGGSHCKTMTNCAVFSAVTFPGSAKLIECFPAFFILFEPYILIFTLILSPLLYYLWAPAQVPEKPISKAYGKKLKTRTFISLTLIFLVLGIVHVRSFPYAYPLVSAACIGILMQSLGITPLGYKLMDGIDFILSWIFKGGVNHEKS